MSSAPDSEYRKKRDAAIRTLDEKIAEHLANAYRTGEIQGAKSFGKPMAESMGEILYGASFVASRVPAAIQDPQERRPASPRDRRFPKAGSPSRASRGVYLRGRAHRAVAAIERVRSVDRTASGRHARQRKTIEMGTR